jgi:Leucine-rich repeat (LRR) protein
MSGSARRRTPTVWLVTALAWSATACSEALAPDGLTVDASLQHARLGEPFEVTLYAEGGEPPYVWSVDSFRGRSPAGFTLSSDGTLSGMPEAVGEVTMSVRVRSADGRAGFAAVPIRVWPDETPMLEPSDRCADFPPWAVVTFEDEDLEGYVAFEADVQSTTYEEGEPLTCEVVASVTRVARGLRTGYVTSLVGIQNLVRTRSLILFVDSISDLTPLAGMPELRTLELSHNQVADLAPLATLPELKTLRMGENLIADVSPLAGLDSLSHIELDHNRIGDVSPLGTLEALRHLDLRDNEIQDISALAALSELSFLDVSNNEITDVTPLAGLHELTDLRLSGLGSVDLAPIGGLTGLTGLRLAEDGIEDISLLAPLTDLTFLDLSFNSISGLGPLAGMTAMEWLTLYSNEIVDLEPLRGLTKIRGLSLGYNQITDVEPLSAYTQLHGLELSYNSTFSDMQPLLEHDGLQFDTTPWIEEFNFRGTSVSCADIDAFRALGAPTISDCP